MQLSSEGTHCTNNCKKNPAISHIHKLFDISHRVFTDASLKKVNLITRAYSNFYVYSEFQSAVELRRYPLLPTTAKRIRQLVTSITFLTSVTAFLQMPIKARQVKRVQITVKSSFLEMWKNPGARFNEKKCFNNKDLGEGVRQTQNRGSKCHKCAMIFFLLWITSRSLML